MQPEQLKSELRAILAVEERNPVDWAAVEQRCLDLTGRLVAEGPWRCPEVVSHFLDDQDIRKKDSRHGDRQREQLRVWLETNVR